MLEVNPKTRITIKQCLQNDFITCRNIDQDSTEEDEEDINIKENDN